MDLNSSAGRARTAALLAHANDAAVRQEWLAGRSSDQEQHELAVSVTDTAHQQLLGTAAYTVHSMLPTSPEDFPLQPALLAPHNSKPNSGTLRKQPSRAECHSNSRPALSYDFSGISRRYEPQPVEAAVGEGGEGGDGGDAADTAALVQGLRTIRIQGTCTVALPPSSAAATGVNNKLKPLRWLVVRDSLPDDVLQLLQPQLQQLERFKAHELQQKQAQEAAAAGRKKPAKKPFSWSDTPLWWVPYDLFVQGGQGWVGGIALYEFPAAAGEGPAAANSGMPQQQQQQPEAHILLQQQQQQLAALHQQQQWVLHQQQLAAAQAQAQAQAQQLSVMQQQQPQPAWQTSVPFQPFPLAAVPTGSQPRGSLEAAAQAAQAAAHEAMAAAAAAVTASTEGMAPHLLHPSAARAAAAAAAAGGGSMCDDGGGGGVDILGIFSSLAADSPALSSDVAPSAATAAMAADSHALCAYSDSAAQHMLPLPLDPLPLVSHHQHQQLWPQPTVQLQQHQPPACSSHAHKQQLLQGLQQQLDALTLQGQQTRAEIQLTRLQQPVVSLQQQTQLSKSLNSTCQLLKTLLLAACAGYLGASSAALFPPLLQHVAQHNSRVADAAVQGLVGVDRHTIDVVSFSEKRFGRSLLHLLVSGFPEPVLVPEGSVQLAGPQDLVQLVTQTAALALATSPSGQGPAGGGDPAIAAADVAGGGAAGLAPPSYSRLSDLVRAAAAAASSTAAGRPANTNTAAGGSSNNSHSSHVSTALPPEQRLQLLQQLRAHAERQGRWAELLQACNSSGATPWLTACHWVIPEVLQFFVTDPSFDLQTMMLCPTKNGRLFYHVIAREACNWQDIDRACFRQALHITMAALADRVAAALTPPQQQQQPDWALSGAQPEHTGSITSGMAAAAGGSGLVLPVSDSPAVFVPTAALGAATAPTPRPQAGGVSSSWGLGPQAASLRLGSPAAAGADVAADCAGEQQQADAASAGVHTEQANKRQRLVQATTLLGGQQQQQLMGASSLSTGVERWPQHVLAALQQQYVFHTDRPRYDVLLLQEVVGALFGFEMQQPVAA